MAEPHVDGDNKNGGHEEYAVEAIKSKKIIDGVTYYLVKWLGWPLEESTWEPEANCEKCENLIQEYEDEQQRKADALVKAEDSSNSSDVEVIYRRRKRGRRKNLSSRNKIDLTVDGDDDDSDYEKSRKSKKRRVKKGSSGSAASRSRHRSSGFSSEDSKRTKLPITSSICVNGITKIEEVDQQQPQQQHQQETIEITSSQPLEQPVNHHQIDESKFEPKFEVTFESPFESKFEITDEPTFLPPLEDEKPILCIESSSDENDDEEEEEDDEEDEDYESSYFGWERGKQIEEILEWYGYRNEILHLVRYTDGEEEYVDDSYTCRKYPMLVYEMYRRYIGEELSENQTIWFNYAIQRFQEIEENGPYENESSGEKQSANESPPPPSLSSDEGDEDSENNENKLDQEIRDEVEIDFAN
ncbi:M-phase phosphoprotein 8-like isoform X2 [Panonychus citri]|uniref:M-phase phosphoprotein 8-like isoform X2 n=1 Tax=Panonychus citri TaxID=50023 RepID=UPI0023081ED0|nr:M-phase phosphoprotein 8-like isoform X2 [Panonychus citri]